MFRHRQFNSKKAPFSQYITQCYWTLTRYTLLRRVDIWLLCGGLHVAVLRTAQQYGEKRAGLSFAIICFDMVV